MNKKQKTGPTPYRIKLDKGWEDVIKDAMQKERPKEGWPKPEKKKKG